MPSSPESAVNVVTTVTAWQAIGMWLSDNIVNIISAISAVLSALYAFQANKNADESQRPPYHPHDETYTTDKET